MVNQKDSETKEINLLPWRSFVRIRHKKNQIFLYVLLCLLILFLLFLWHERVSYQIKMVKNQQNTLEKRLHSLLDKEW